MEVTGKILEYKYESGERYRLLFGIKTVTWKCMAGLAAGLSGTDSYGAIEIAPDIFFISWSKTDDEVVSIVADFKKDILHCCHTQKGTRFFVKGNIERFDNAPVNRSQIFS